MSRTFFASALECVAIYWRIERRDGVSLGFTSHDRNLEFDGLLFRSAPGMVPSAIRLTAGLDADSTAVQGSLGHDAINELDLGVGRFDSAMVEIGLVDWESLERVPLYSGQFGTVSAEGTTFECELRSAKSLLDIDVVPRTSPTCRAIFCGPGCGLSAHRFTHEAAVSKVNMPSGIISFVPSNMSTDFIGGTVRWIDGPFVGIEMFILDVADDGVLLDIDFPSSITPGMRALVREACDHTLAACSQRFSNAVNFQGEPFLPGNDAIVRYPTSSD